MDAARNIVGCLVCGSGLDTPADVMANELIECDDCGSEFEVVSTVPLTITEAPHEEEDWGE
jgi:alpha-aminoadipate carrier protein LysW